MRDTFHLSKQKQAFPIGYSTTFRCRLLSETSDISLYSGSSFLSFHLHISLLKLLFWTVLCTAASWVACPLAQAHHLIPLPRAAFPRRILSNVCETRSTPIRNKKSVQAGPLLDTKRISLSSVQYSFFLVLSCVAIWRACTSWLSVVRSPLKKSSSIYLDDRCAVIEPRHSRSTAKEHQLIRSRSHPIEFSAHHLLGEFLLGALSSPTENALFVVRR